VERARVVVEGHRVDLEVQAADRLDREGLHDRLFVEATAPKSTNSG
jgi:hypothetical protein